MNVYLFYSNEVSQRRSRSATPGLRGIFSSLAAAMQMLEADVDYKKLDLYGLGFDVKEERRDRFGTNKPLLELLATSPVSQGFNMAMITDALCVVILWADISVTMGDRIGAQTGGYVDKENKRLTLQYWIAEREVEGSPLLALAEQAE